MPRTGEYRHGSRRRRRRAISSSSQVVEFAVAVAPSEEGGDLGQRVDQRRPLRVARVAHRDPAPPGSSATSTQLPLGLLRRLLRQVTAGQPTGWHAVVRGVHTSSLLKASPKAQPSEIDRMHARRLLRQPRSFEEDNARAPAGADGCAVRTAAAPAGSGPGTSGCRVRSMEGRTVVDPGTVASCVAAAAGACAGWQLRRRRPAGGGRGGHAARRAAGRAARRRARPADRPAEPARLPPARRRAARRPDPPRPGRHPARPRRLQARQRHPRARRRRPGPGRARPPVRRRAPATAWSAGSAGTSSPRCSAGPWTSAGCSRRAAG